MILDEIEPSVLCLSETALHEHEHITISNYSMVANYNRKCNERGGGVMLFVNNFFSQNVRLSFREIDISAFCHDKIFEACSIKIECNSLHLIIICVYRPPSLLRFKIDLFISCLTEVLEYVGDIIILVMLLLTLTSVILQWIID